MKTPVIAGIAVASVVAVISIALLALLCMCCARRRRRRAPLDMAGTQVPSLANSSLPPAYITKSCSMDVLGIGALCTYILRSVSARFGNLADNQYAYLRQLLCISGHEQQRFDGTHAQEWDTHT